MEFKWPREHLQALLMLPGMGWMACDSNGIVVAFTNCPIVHSHANGYGWWGPYYPEDPDNQHVRLNDIDPSEHWQDSLVWPTKARYLLEEMDKS